MRILHIIPSLNKRKGGPAESLRQMIPLLNKKGIDSTIVTLDDPSESYKHDVQSDVVELGPTSTTYGYTGELIKWLKKNKNNFDAVIVRGIWQYHSFAIWKVFRDSEIPYFVYTHGMLAPWFKEQHKLKHIKKWIYWPWAEYRVLRDASAVLFTTEEERIRARESFWLYKCTEEVIRYGTSGRPSDIEGDELAIYKKHPELKSKPYFIFMGRIHQIKGCDLIIKAFANTDTFKDAYLVMAGPDDCDVKSKLTKLVEENNLQSHVIWAGMLTAETKWSALSKAEALLLPSHHENFGVTVAESLSSGTPVLISNKVNIWREVKEGRCGIVEDDTLEGTERLFQRWNDLSGDEKLDMRNNSIECFLEKFHISEAVNSLLSVLNKYVVLRDNG